MAIWHLQCSVVQPNSFRKFSLLVLGALVANQGLENTEPGPLGLMALCPLQRAHGVECTLKERERCLLHSDDYNQQSNALMIWSTKQPLIIFVLLSHRSLLVCSGQSSHCSYHLHEIPSTHFCHWTGHYHLQYCCHWNHRPTFVP